MCFGDTLRNQQNDGDQIKRALPHGKRFFGQILLIIIRANHTDDFSGFVLPVNTHLTGRAVCFHVPINYKNFISTIMVENRSMMRCSRTTSQSLICKDQQDIAFL